MPRHAELEFVERFGRMFEEVGGSRTSGRIVGWLLLCDPPEQSQPELVTALAVSKASISTELRALAARGLVERTTRPGDRRSYYRIQDDAWSQLIERRTRMIREFRQAASDGLKLLGRAAARRRARLELLARVYGHMERALLAALAEIKSDVAEFDRGRGSR